MSLRIGTTLGAYEVLALEGVGGMGEVYRARDTKLHRDVALKVLPERFADDPHRLARFTREAHILASLNHPNIAAVYGIEDATPPPKLVLEWVDGDTLAERIAQRPIPVDEALAIARQIADAVEAAHDSGVIHRDLKPSNIKVRPDGSVKVLDFGLAKALDPIEGVGDGELTMTAPVGQVVMLGTAPYMSPEQARGQKVDKRTDVWAFGCILYELLTARRAFDGENTSATLAAVLHGEPDWDRVPAKVRPLLRKCLEKDPRNRLRDLGDAMSLVEVASASSASAPVAIRRIRGWVWSVVAVAIISAAAAAMVVLRDEPPPEQPTRLQIPLPSGFINSFIGAPFLSPDGRRVAIVEATALRPLGRRVWVYSLDSGEWRSLSSIEIGPGGHSGLFWSPDGRFLALKTSGRLSKIDVTSDTSQTLCECAGVMNGGDWGQGDVILFSCNNVVMKISAAGGNPVQLTALDESRKEIGHSFPRFVDDRRFVYLRQSPATEGSGIFVGSLDAKPEEQPLTRLVATRNAARFARSHDGVRGYLLFTRETALMAQEINLSTLQPTGDAVVAEEIRSGAFSVSETGMLAYRTSEPVTGTPVWVDRQGRELASLVQSPLADPLNPRLSPDGGRLALIVDGDLWVYDLTGKPPVKLTFNASNDLPLWTRDGKRLLYAHNAPPPQRLMSVAADNPGDTPVPASPEGHYHPHGWSHDGSELVAVINSYSPTRWDLMGLRDFGKEPPRPLLRTAAADGEAGAQLSPDGRWLACASNISGSREVWVQPYPGPGQPRRVSTNGGTDPQWARNGRELYYIEQSGANKLMAVPVLKTATFDFGTPTLLFESSYAHLFGGPNSYDVAADGRFLMIKPAPAPSWSINVILNWMAALTH